MLSIQQAAARLGVPRGVVHVAVRDGKLPAQRFMLGGKRFISESALQAFEAVYITPLKDAGEFAGGVSS